MRLEIHRLTMKLKRPFTIAAGTMTETTSLLARLQLDGHEGFGEAAPSARVTGETLDASRHALEGWANRPDDLAQLFEAAEFSPGGSDTPAARSALITAYLDAYGKRNNAPLRDLLNLPEGRLDSSITLSIGTAQEVLAEAATRDREGWKVFKVKLGGPHDEAALRALRDRYPEKRIYVDANEGWTPHVAESRLRLLEQLNVEFVEQPLPRDQLDETAALAKKFDIPIILDEALLDSKDALELVQRDVADGGNIKLAKCGGPLEARRIVKILRDAGWKVMMGCMVESSLGIATAAAFAGALDYADLDGHELLAEDPFKGFATPAGDLSTPEGNGVGVVPKDPAKILEGTPQGLR